MGAFFSPVKWKLKKTSSTYFSKFYEDQMKHLRQERSALHSIHYGCPIANHWSVPRLMARLHLLQLAWC